MTPGMAIMALVMMGPMALGKMAEDQSHVLDAQGPGRQYVLAALIAVKLGADHPGRSNPVLDHQAEDDGKDPRTKKQDEQRHHHDLRERADDLGDTHHDHIHLAAVIACDGAVYDADAHLAGDFTEIKAISRETLWLRATCAPRDPGPDKSVPIPEIRSSSTPEYL